jgi:hypothetical protein
MKKIKGLKEFHTLGVMIVKKKLFEIDILINFFKPIKNY